MDFGSVLAALALGLVVGVFGRMFTPGDVFSQMSGPKSWGISIGLGLISALLGYWFFTSLLGIGDENKFDWGGILGAFVFAVPVVLIASFVIKRTQK